VPSLFLLSSRAARASGSPDPELHGDSVNQPARATEEARELLVREGGVGNDQVADCLVRPRGASFLQKPNPDHFSSGVLDFTVVTHSLRKRDRVFALQLTDDLSGSENRTNNGNLTVPALNPAKDFGFLIPSLEGGRSDRPVRSGILLGNASTVQTSEFR
jgi:hypothetical protein